MLNSQVKIILNWSKMLSQINQEILKASKNIRNFTKAFQLIYQKLVRICWECSTGFIYGFVIQVIREKTLSSNDLLAIWETFLHENNRNYNSYIFSYKFTFILFLAFLYKQKQESCFQQVSGLVTRKISVFCL